MNASEWREVPGYGQRGVDILADLEAAEKARDKWEVQAERNRDVADKQYARAEKAEADFDSEREACAAAVRQWNKAEVEVRKYADAYTQLDEDCANVKAERDALQSELADYKESWKEREFPKTSYEAERRWSEACARIRARREKEAGR
jgi:chromosome segregation ATPase